MARLQIEFFSQALRRIVTVQVILPTDKILTYGEQTKEVKPFKTLYLLHGLLGNNMDWLVNTNIQNLAEDKNLAVVMPSGENSFYVDWEFPGNGFGKYIGCELVAITRKMFPLSHERKDTFIAGFSMGGFGAVRNGLKYYDTFGYIAGFSSALRFFETDCGSSVKPEDLWFGDWKQAVSTDKNPRVAFELMEEAVKNNPEIGYPQIFISCGLQDGLLDVNRSLKNFFVDKGVDVTYEEVPGGHNWIFWQEQIIKLLDWLPLDKGVAGISSGNVKYGNGSVRL